MATRSRLDETLIVVSKHLEEVPLPAGTVIEETGERTASPMDFNCVVIVANGKRYRVGEADLKAAKKTSLEN